MLETALAACVAAFALGWLTGRRQSDPKPMRLVSTFAMTPPGLVAQPAAELEQWRLYVTAFAWQANMLGSFSYRTLAGAGVCRRAAWEAYTRVLREAGVIAGGERSATTWAGGYSYSRLRAELKHGRLRPPYPAGSPPALNSGWLASQTAHHTTPGTRHARAGLHKTNGLTLW